MGEKVYFLYRGKLLDGTEIDAETEEPYEIVIGRRQVFKPIEDALKEMSEGEERTLRISTSDAYGEYREDAVQRVATSMVPDGAKLPEGETILWQNPRTPQPIPAKVLEKNDFAVTLDFNHPLAGKDLEYWIKKVPAPTID